MTSTHSSQLALLPSQDLLSSTHLLLEAYLRNVQAALIHDRTQHAEKLLSHALDLMGGTPLTGLDPVSPDLPIQFHAAVGLDVGLKRRGIPNEDYPFAIQGTVRSTSTPFGLFVVADGMGGHANGQEASRLAIETIVDHVLPQVWIGRCQGPDLGSLLTSAVQAANSAIFQHNQEHAATDRMGTTVTAALFVGAQAWVTNVGDSRTYVWRPERGLLRLTHDHSVVAGLAAQGVIAPDDIYTHPQRNEIYRSLGDQATVEVDLSADWLADGDVLLLCSDGLWEMTRDPMLADILSQSWLTASQMAEQFVQLALSGGGLDNIGLVVVRVKICDVARLQTIVGRDALLTS